MNSTSIIRTITPEEWDTYKHLRLKALADSPDAFARTLAEEQGRSDAEWYDRLAKAANSRWNLPLMAEIDGRPVGLAWGRIEQSNPDLANLYQMWVAPDSRCHGIGQMLLEAVITWAKQMNASYLDLGVTCRDSSAMRLYQRLGFEPVGQPHPLRPGSELLCQDMRFKLKSNTG
ncbi:MAG: GNAT family N-acetyltransferase [Chloroflexota bacterium]